MSSFKFTDPKFLRSEQYRDGTNLNARADLHARFSTSPEGWPRWVFDQYTFPEQARLLVLGGGPGIIWGANKDRIRPEWWVVFTDLSEGMLAEARETLSGEVTRFASVDAQALPFPTNFFDVVTANHMLFHLADRPKAFKEIRRVLKRGGRLYAGTNGKEHLVELTEIINQFDPSIEYERFSLGFSLENGAAQLGDHFERVARHDYPDGLAVTEAEPLAAYFRSLASLEESLPSDRTPELLDYLEGLLAEKGVIEITKAVGLFVADKAGM